MGSRHTGLGTTAALVATGVAGLLTGCSGDDDSAKKPPARSGIVTTKQAREVPLDTPRDEFDTIIKEPAVRVRKRRVPRQEAKLADIPRAATRQKLQEKFGRAKGGKVVIPPQTFTCLLYRGEAPERNGWQFCFGEAGRLESVSTTPPL